MRVEATVEVRPTEVFEKVWRALTNVFAPDRWESRREGRVTVIRAYGYSYRSLERLRAAIFRQGIQDAARAVISRGIIDENRVMFSLHKQAAYVGVVSFVTEPGESPLGPITFIVETSDVRQFLDWIAPRTYRGRIMYESPPPD